jgi:mannitol-1-phosphate/altronate dehydrogenase
MTTEPRDDDPLNSLTPEEALSFHSFDTADDAIQAAIDAMPKNATPGILNPSPRYGELSYDQANAARHSGTALGDALERIGRLDRDTKTRAMWGALQSLPRRQAIQLVKELYSSMASITQDSDVLMKHYVPWSVDDETENMT